MESGKSRVAMRVNARVDTLRLALLLDDADEPDFDEVSHSERSGLWKSASEPGMRRRGSRLPPRGERLAVPVHARGEVHARLLDGVRPEVTGDAPVQVGGEWRRFKRREVIRGLFQTRVRGCF